MNPSPKIKAIAEEQKTKAIAKVKLLIGAITIPPIAIAVAIGLSSPAIAPTKAEALVAQKIEQDKLLAKYENADTLSDTQLAELLYAVGFRGQDLVEAWAVAKKETNGRPLAHNGNRKTGDNSYGLFQVNMLGDMGADRRDIFGLNHNADLLNPVINAQVAYHMSNGGKDWSSWKGLTPKTKALMKKFPKNFKKPKP
jgi:Lysozyme like domain